MSITHKFSCLFLLYATQFSYALTVMFDPAGDAKRPGNRIGNTYERTLTGKLVDELKQQFALSDKKIRVLLSRLPGEQKDPIEKLRCVHQCVPDYFIHITIFESTHIKPEIFFYVNEENKSINVRNRLLPINQAHNPYTQSSKNFAETLYASLQNIGSTYTLHAPRSIPCSILKGIPTRSCIVEIGIKSSSDLQQCIPNLAKSILEACKAT